MESGMNQDNKLTVEVAEVQSSHWSSRLVSFY